MSTAITFTSETPPPFPMHRFTVAEYRKLGELGVLAPYAAAGVIEYWIVNPIDRRLERFQQSDGSAYCVQTFIAPDDTVELELDGMRYPLKLAVLFSADA